MAFQVSAGVNVSEIDLTTTIPAVSTSVGALAGFFRWGPCLKIRQISSENELVATFGPPGDRANAFFTAASFLSYSADLRVVRTKETAATNAGSAGSVSVIGNEDEYDATYYDANNVSVFAARYPGDLGNGLKVGIWANTNAATWNTWEYAAYFDRRPGTSATITKKYGNSAANDQVHIIVIDAQGKFTGVANTVLEKYEGLSKATNIKRDGESLYWRDVISKKSKYIYVTGKPAGDWEVAANTTQIFTQLPITSNSYVLTGGLNDASPSAGALQTAYDKFRENDVGEDISLVMTGGDFLDTIALYTINNIAEIRKDCVVFVSPTLANATSTTATTAVVDFRNNVMANVSSSYAVMDSGWKYMYDKYNDRYRWVPLNGDIAGVCARTDLDRDPWFSPAGLQRGQIKNALRLAYNPTKSQRDSLYQNGVNPVISAAGDGTILFGDKTLQGYASAFDRINVRRLFIVLEKAISIAARTSLFEFNDEFTRAQFVNLVEPYLRTVQGRRGIIDFRVVCDETNNTSDVIDRNEFIGDIYVKPSRSINYIQLNFVAIATGVSFDEIVGSVV